jgi:predicted deacetylase
LAKFVIRLDDAHPRMDVRKWSQIERILNQYDVNPLVAVIPYNLDKSLNHDPEDQMFWTKVRSWEVRGWTIALHGYQHLYHDVNPKRSILPLHKRSEFSGLPLDLQEKKIKKGYELLKKNMLNPKAFVAPSHTFDANTLKALTNKTDIRIISDGWSIGPYYENNFLFVPQQLWAFSKKKFGTWTVCLHPDTMDDHAFIVLEQKLNEFRDDIVSFNELKLHSVTRKGIFDIIFIWVMTFKIQIKRVLRLH